MFAEAIRQLRGTIKQAAGLVVRYERGEDVLVAELRVVTGNTPYESMSMSGVVITSQSRDYVVEVADLVRDDDETPIVPERGDRVVEVRPEGEAVFELLDMPGANCWRWSDSYYIARRLHTKQIAGPM